MRKASTLSPLRTVRMHVAHRVEGKADMDGHRFDALTRMLGKGVTRRTAVVALVAEVIVPLVLVQSVAARRRRDETQRDNLRGDHRRRHGKSQDSGHNANKRQQKRKDAHPNRRSDKALAVASCCAGGNCAPGPKRNLASCCYQNQNLSKANFSTSNLTKAIFTESTLTNANLNGANLDSACLVGANLKGASVTGVNLRGAILCRTTMPNGAIDNSGCGRGTSCCRTCDTNHSCPESGQVCCDGTCKAAAACKSVAVCPTCATASLEDALAATAPGGKVVLAAGEYAAPVLIAKSVTISGAGPDKTILTRTYAPDEFGPVVTVDPVATVEIKSVTVTGGQSDIGGGIVNAGTLTLTDCQIHGNSATDAVSVTFRSSGARTMLAADPRVLLGDGGGIVNTGSVNMVNTTVSNNTSKRGGGIANTGTLKVTNTTVTNNTSNRGGGVVNTGGAVTVDTGAKITDNRAKPTPGTPDPALGGNGGGIVNTGGTVTVKSGGKITNNRAETGPQAPAPARAGLVQTAEPKGSGGAIFNELGGKLTLENGSEVKDNVAEASGGAIYNKSGDILVKASTVSGNTASVQGGAIYNELGGKVTLEAGSKVNGNVAKAPDMLMVQDVAHGGAIYNASDAELVLRAGSTIANNFVAAPNASSESNLVNALLGAGIFNSGSVTLKRDSLVSGNKVDVPISIAMAQYAGNGGGIYNAPGAKLIMEAGSKVTSNIAKMSATDTLLVGFGGGIYNEKGNFKLEAGSKVSSNTAEAGGGVYNECPDGTCQAEIGAPDVLQDNLPANCGGDRVTPRAYCGCPAGQSICGDQCLNLANNPYNCGTCGNRCPQGETCVAGGCQALECPSAYLPCDGTCEAAVISTCPTVAGGVIYVSSRPGNCEVQCASDDDCNGGVCVTNHCCGGPGYSSACIPANALIATDAGSICGSGGPVKCPVAELPCNGSCEVAAIATCPTVAGGVVYVSSHPGNCAAQCASDADCGDGVCVTSDCCGGPGYPSACMPRQALLLTCPA